MTRGDLRDKLQNHFNNIVYYTNQDMYDSIQDGIDEVAAFSGICYGSAALDFQSNLSYYDMITLLPNYIGVISIFNHVTNRWMNPTSLKKLEAMSYAWDTVGGTPELFSPINHRYVVIFRKPLVPNYGKMLVFYRAAAPVLTESTVIPMADEYIDAIEHYCMTDLWEQAQEWGKSSMMFQQYQAALENVRVAIRNKRNSDRLMSLKG